MWPSLPTANHIADVANWFFIGSLVVGVVSTILIVWMAGVKEAYWEKDRAESTERIALLNNDTEHLKSENLRLQAQLAPRSLSKEQFDEIQTLKGKISQVNLATEDNLESKMFAGLLATALQKAGITVRGYNLPPGHRGNTGLVLYDQYAFSNPHGEPTKGEPLYGVLMRAKLFFGTVVSRLPDALAIPPDVPAIFVVEKPSLPYASTPYFGPPDTPATPEPTATK
jgi:hypothetical protein